MRASRGIGWGRAACIAALAGLLPAAPTPAGATEPCTAGLPEIEAALQTGALDAYTAAQVESLRRALAEATQAGDIPGCKAAIDQLRDILHLNH